MDYDKDGDTDIFVGSRSIPGAYGITPHSYLLQNNGSGIFTEVTSDIKDNFSDTGMITDAAWADIDNDGFPDLVLAGEWMPVTIFMNNHGKLIRSSGPNGLNKSDGWWFSLKVKDLDHDGDLDLIAGNLGMNAMITADTLHPARIYINDFDNNGISDPVITSYRNRNYYPVASIDDLKKQITFLRNNFQSYAALAGLPVDKLLPPDKLNKSIIKSVYNFQSGVFMNQGNANFIFKPFPVEVQFSPVMDFMIDDFDSDGILDILLAGNFFQTMPYLGRYDASYGWYLKGTGNDNFKVIWPYQSGWSIRGEVNQLAKLRYDHEMVIIAGLNNARARFFTVNSKSKN
jgi:hypothetical protein